PGQGPPPARRRQWPPRPPRPRAAGPGPSGSGRGHHRERATRPAGLVRGHASTDAVCSDPVSPKYPNALLLHRLHFYHDARFHLNCVTLSPILLIYGRRLGRADRGMDWKKLLGSVTESVDEELRLRNAYLVAENRMLHQQINGRMQLTDSDRQALAELGQRLGKKAPAEIATLAKTDTIPA